MPSTKIKFAYATDVMRSAWKRRDPYLTQKVMAAAVGFRTAVGVRGFLYEWWAVTQLNLDRVKRLAVILGVENEEYWKYVTPEAIANAERCRALSADPKNLR